MSSQEIPEQHDQFTAELLEHIRSLEELLNLPTGFFLRVLEEDDDWSFIIKTHALIESGTTRFLEAVTTPTMPSAFLETLPLSGGRHSKLELLQLLGHLESDHVKFIKRLSHLRNLLVHNVANVGFVLADYLASLSPQDVNNFMSETCCNDYNPENFKSEQEKEKQRAEILTKPRLHIWRTALFYLAMTSLKLDNARLEKRVERLEKRTEKAEQEALKAEREALIREVHAARRIAEGLAGGKNLGLEIYRQRLRDRGDASSNATR